jgi:hypothetical protein
MPVIQGLGWTFDTVSSAYEKLRPGYVDELYQTLFAHYEKVNIFTRTWSANFAHIRILEKYGFRMIVELPNDRGIGIHTVYFQKSPV